MSGYPPDNRQFYDPPSGGISSENQNPTAYQDPKVQALQQDINDVTSAIRSNLSKTDQAGERLEVLENRTDHMAATATGFRTGASKVRRRMMWKHLKWKFILAGGIILLLVVIIVPAVVTSKNKE